MAGSKVSVIGWTMRSYGICLLVLTLMSVGAYAVPIDLGEAESFGVLAGSGVTNAHPGTYITGDVGSFPTPAVTGLTAAMVNGNLYLAGAPLGAKTDLLEAYNAARDAEGATDMSGMDLGALGDSLAPGVYSFSSSVGLTGRLTLDGGGNPNAQWIFQIGSTLTTGSNSGLSFVNGALAYNVFWQVGSSATIGVESSFAGNILAHESITLNGGTLDGRALALNGAVTISGGETITVPVVPEPATSVLLLVGLGVGLVSRRRRRSAR